MKIPKSPKKAVKNPKSPKKSPKNSKKQKIDDQKKDEKDYQKKNDKKTKEEIIFPTITVNLSKMELDKEDLNEEIKKTIEAHGKANPNPVQAYTRALAKISGNHCWYNVIGSSDKWVCDCNEVANTKNLSNYGCSFHGDIKELEKKYMEFMF